MKVAHLRMIVAVCAASLSAYACTDTSPTEVVPNKVSASVVGSGAKPMTIPSPLMTAHSGTVLTFTHTYAMFWGTTWNTDMTFTGDRITAMNTFLDGFGGSNYANILTEYGVTTQSTHVTTIVDNSPAPPSDPGVDGLGHYACDLLGAHGYTPDFNAIYIVYATTPPSGSASGYHTNFSCGGIRIHTVLVFQTSNVLPPGQTPPFYHSVAATTMAGITAHEISESITDEYVGHGWWSGLLFGETEIADKCFTAPPTYVTLANSSTFLLPLLWSNFAYTKGTGVANGDGDHGCVGTGVQWPHATISGPTITHQYQPATFSVSITGGTPPYTYYWYFANSIPTFVLPTGSSQTFTTTQYGSPVGNPDLLLNSVSDAQGRTVSSSYSIVTSY